MHRLSFRCPINMFKGKLLKLNFRFLISYFKRCHFLTLILSQIVANYAQRIVFNNDMSHSYIKAEIGRQSGNVLPVYLILPLSIYLSRMESCL